MQNRIPGQGWSHIASNEKNTKTIGNIKKLSALQIALDLTRSLRLKKIGIVIKERQRLIPIAIP